MIEASIFKFISNREKYNKYKDLLKGKFFTPHTEFIFKEMESVLVSEEFINWDTFLSLLELKYPSMKEDRKLIYKDIINHINDVDDDAINASIIEGFVSRESAGRIYSIADAIFSGMGSYTIDDIKNILSDYDKDIEIYQERRKNFITKDPGKLRTAVSSASGYEWRLDALNKSLGPLVPSSLVLFCARPDGGKTTMVISEAGYMASQLKEDETILFVCNEEPGENVMVRLICSITGITLKDYDSDPYGAFDNYITMCGGDKIEVYYEESCKTTTVEKLIEQNNVKLLVLDQLRKLNIGSNRNTEQEYQRLSRLFTWARGIGSRYGIPVLCVHQCDGTAEGLKYLHMGQIHGSNTDIQGECDAIVMIGKAHGEDTERGMTIVKNKFPGADPAHRNYAWDVKIDREIGRFHD